jgi:hypothetical protein
MRLLAKQLKAISYFQAITLVSSSNPFVSWAMASAMAERTIAR